MAALATVPVPMTVAAFLAWNPGDGRRWELVDGKPRAMAPASLVHGALQSELGSLIRNYLRARRSPCIVVTNPGVVPDMQSSHNFRIPDLGVTCSPLEAGAYGLPDPILLVEILSPSNRDETWANVWTYTTIPSVREVLVLWTATVGAEVLRREAGGAWPREPEQRVTDGDLVLDSIGLRVPLADPYRDTHLGRRD